MPSILLGDDPARALPDIEELAARRLSLAISLEWLDDRRWFPLWFITRRHRARTVIDIAAYAASNLKALRVADATLLSELHAARTSAERQHGEESARARMNEHQLPPDIQAQIEAEHLSASIALWRARGRYLRKALLRRSHRRTNPKA
jgi:hypothetical protein